MENMLLKFRAFDPEYKKMHHDVMVGYDGQVVVAQYTVDQDDSDIDMIYFTCNNRDNPPEFTFRVMQYMGSEDFTGKEIYTGDIVRYAFDWMSDENGDKKEFKPETKKYKHSYGVITFERETSSYIISPSRICCRTDMNIIEVVGNVYENPDLLQKYSIDYKIEDES